MSSGSTGDLLTSSSTGDLSTSGSTSMSMTTATTMTPGTDSSGTTLVYDVGSGSDSDSDSSDTKPLGCQGKIDFLFVIEGTHVMAESQEKLIEAFPKFIQTIETKFDDFDYHIMVVEMQDEWGEDECSADCPLLDCKIGEPCCPWGTIDGDPCCPLDYPCEEVGKVSACDRKLGAGTITPAGFNASNKRCDIANGRRYMTKGQPDLAETFACVAQVGTSGDDRAGDALVEAVSYKFNIAGGCNAGFLRDDALLMVTLITDIHDQSKTYIYPWEWYDKVLVAKNGDPSSVIALLIGSDNCEELHNYPCQFVEMFTHHLVEGLDASDYGPAFDQATDLVAAACEDFIPQ